MLRLLQKVSAALVIVFGLVLVHTFLNVYNADVSYSLSQQSLDSAQLSTAIDYANDAIKRNPMEPNYYRGRARVFITSLVSADSVINMLIKNQVLKDLTKAYNLNPNNLVTARNLVPLYYFLASKDLSKPSSPTNIDPEFLPYAISYFREIEDMSPNDVGVYVLLAKYEKRLGLTTDYIRTINKIKVLRPDLLDWYEGLK